VGSSPTARTTAPAPPAARSRGIQVDKGVATMFDVKLRDVPEQLVVR
jgi:hypothetical protein